MSEFTYSFAGANTPLGFFSIFDDVVASSRHCRIIKGCPGGGKSTFMRTIAEALRDNGAEVELLRCASDPSSLDGFVCKDLSVAYLDGTPPHALEVRYPGAAETYVDLGRFMNVKALEENLETIKNIYDRYDSSKAPAFQCLKAAKELDNIILGDVIMMTDFEKLGRRCSGIIRRELHKSKHSGKGRAYRRFTESISHKGYTSDLSQCCDLRVYSLESSYGLSRFFTQRIASSSLELGLDIIACLDVMEPQGSPRHIIIPDMELAFVTSTPRHPYMYEPYRRVHLDSAIDKARLARLRKSLRYHRKTADALIDNAVQYLQTSYSIHQELEAAYKPYMDFSGVSELCRHHIDSLLSSC